MESQSPLTSPEGPNQNNLQPNVNKPDAALTQQPVILSQPTVSVSPPIVVGGHNEAHERSRSPLNIGSGLVILSIVILIFLTGIGLYLWLLPTIWSNSYLNRIKPAYETQASQINTVFTSLGDPIFSNAGSSQTTNTQDIQHLISSVETAQTNTSSLKAKDHIIILPGSTWLHAVSLANSEHAAMQQYISDSQSFLSDYKTLLIYIEQISQIAQVQLPSLITNLSAVNQGSTSQSAFLSELQKTSSNLQSFVNQVKGLKAPPDLQGFNQDLLTDLSDMNSALSEQQGDVQSNNSSNFVSQAEVYASSLKDFVSLLESNPTANIQTNSIIQGQVKALEAEHPLK